VDRSIILLHKSVRGAKVSQSRPTNIAKATVCHVVLFVPVMHIVVVLPGQSYFFNCLLFRHREINHLYPFQTVLNTGFPPKYHQTYSSSPQDLADTRRKVGGLVYTIAYYAFI
jgi:hypothetical protein